MKLYITRHGQTFDNLKELSSGQNQAQITEVGITQAEALGKRLASFGIQRALASDLERVKQTIKAMSIYFTCAVEYRPELRERNYGELEGTLSSYYHEVLARSGQSNEEYRPQGGESYQDLRARLAPIIGIINQESQSADSLLILGHGNVNRTLMAMLLGKAPGDFTQRTACLNILEIFPDQKPQVLMIDNIDHYSDV